MTNVSNSTLKELDFIELILLCIRYKRIFILTLLISSLISSLLIFYSSKERIKSEIKFAYVNILINEDFNERTIAYEKIINYEIKKTGLIFERSIKDWKNQFSKRINSSLNYEKWSIKNKLQSVVFSQVDAQTLNLSEYNTIEFEYDTQDYLNAAVSYINHTVKNQQDLVETMINIDNKFQLRLLEEKINNLLNEKVILKNKSEIITKHFKEGKYENEYSNYITQLISIRSAVSNNEYSINTAKLKLSSLKKTITNQENSETKSEIKLFETGKINKVTKKIKKEKRLLNKYPMAIYVLVIIVDIFVFILLIVFFRSLEEIRFRTKNKE